MHQEIERKFLICGDYKSLASAHSRMTQGYICSARGRTVRVRIVGAVGYLTIKGPTDEGGLGRMEWEQEIALDDARELMTLCETHPIDKTRWFVPSGQHIFEVDEFHGLNEGLVVAEVELTHEDEAYTAPPFLGKEVTGDRRYYNSFLTHHPFLTWP
jgi:CYTH domain-containing protein